MKTKNKNLHKHHNQCEKIKNKKYNTTCTYIVHSIRWSKKNKNWAWYFEREQKSRKRRRKIARKDDKKNCVRILRAHKHKWIVDVFFLLCSSKSEFLHLNCPVIVVNQLLLSIACTLTHSRGFRRFRFNFLNFSSPCFWHFCWTSLALMSLSSLLLNGNWEISMPLFFILWESVKKTMRHRTCEDHWTRLTHIPFLLTHSFCRTFIFSEKSETTDKKCVVIVYSIKCMMNFLLHKTEWGEACRNKESKRWMSKGLKIYSISEKLTYKSQVESINVWKCKKWRS